MLLSILSRRTSLPVRTHESLDRFSRYTRLWTLALHVKLPYLGIPLYWTLSDRSRLFCLIDNAVDVRKFTFEFVRNQMNSVCFATPSWPQLSRAGLDLPTLAQHLCSTSPLRWCSGSKKPAWGGVSAVAAVSIKDQEAEAEKARSQGRNGPQQRVLNSEGVPKPVSERPPSSGGIASAGWSNRRSDGPSGDERPSYGDRPPRGDSYGDRPSYGGDRPSYGGDRPSYGDRPPRGDSYGDRPPRGEYGDRPERRERAEVPFPTSAPYVLYLSGLPYGGTEADVLDLLPEFLGEELNAQVKGVKVPIKDGKLRHAFIEFNEADGLRDALTLSGREFMGRTVACLVADAPPARRDDGARWGSGSGFSSSFARRDNFDGGSRGDGGARGFGGQRPSRYDERPAERKPLNLAPRSSDAGSSSNSGAKDDPFGGATATSRDIYADKPKPAPAPAAARAPRAPAKPATGAEEPRADTRDWKAKNKDWKPSTFGGDRQYEAAAPRATGAGRGGARAAPQQEGEWKSAGGGSKPQQQRSKAAPLNNANSGEASNPFDLLGNE